MPHIIKAAGIAITAILLSYNTLQAFAIDWINNGVSVVINNSTALVIQGNCINEDGGYYINRGTIKLKSDWVNNASDALLKDTSGTFKLYGTTQSITGTYTNSFYHLTLSSSGNIRLATDATVKGILSLGSVKLNIDSHTLSLNNTATSALTYTTGYIQTADTSSNFIRRMASIGTYYFPLATANTTLLRPIQIIPSTADTQKFSVALIEGDASDDGFDINNTSTGIVTLNSNYYQKIKRTEGDDPVTIKLSHNPTIDGFYSLPAHWQDEPEWAETGSNTPEVSGSLTYYSILSHNDFSYWAFSLCRSVKNVAYPSTDTTMNWVYTRSYDLDSNVIGESLQYMDNLGRPTQSQSKDLETGHILATQTVYDNFGRPAVQTLAAPVNSGTFGYKDKFIANATTNNNYAYGDFTGTNLNNPVAVRNTDIGTLGWYYSDGNTIEPYVATTSYPYAHNHSINDAASKSSMPGDSMKMGIGHDSWQFQSIAANSELKTFMNNGYQIKFDTLDPLSSSEISGGNSNSIRSLYSNPEGKDMISYSASGRKVCMCESEGTALPLASAYHIDTSGNPFNVYLPKKNTSMIFWVPKYIDGFQNYFNPVDTHLDISVTDLKLNYKLIKGVDYSITGSGTGGLPKRFVNLLGIYSDTTQNKMLKISFRFTSWFWNYLVNNNYVFEDGEVELQMGYIPTQCTKYYYDLSGQLRKTIDPKGLVTTYDYDPLGRLIGTRSPDEGETHYIYDTEGKIRFSQNAQQKLENKFSYTNYDRAGRVVEAGEYVWTTNGVFFQDYYAVDTLPSGSTSTLSILDSLDGLDNGRCSNQIYTTYDEIESTEMVTDDFDYKENYPQNNIMARVAKTKNQEQSTWYSYDYLGRTENIIQQVQGLSEYAGDSVDEGVFTVDYEYNSVGGVSKVTYQKYYISQKLSHFYSYDANQRLKSVSVSSENNLVSVQARYKYYLHGPLKRTEIGDSLQGIDYVYTVNGQLKSINHPSLREVLDPGKDGYNNGFNKDLFGMALDYYPNDYMRSGDDSVGAEELVTNGDFDTDSDWEKNLTAVPSIIADGKATLATSSATACHLYQNVSFEAGHTYLITYEISNLSSTSPSPTKFVVYSYFGGPLDIEVGSNPSNGIRNIIFNAASNSNRIAFVCNGVSSGSTSFQVDNVSIKEITNMPGVQSLTSGGSFDGLINRTRYKTLNAYAILDTTVLINSDIEQLSNQYTYDNLYRLTKSEFGVYNSSTQTTALRNDYKVSGITYDDNGNILTLNRNDYLDTEIGYIMDSLSYKYLANSNRLDTIIDYIDSIRPGDFHTVNGTLFKYNAIGQLTKSVPEYIDTILYTPYGKVSKVIWENGDYAEYKYNDRGTLVSTEFKDITTNKSKWTWYATDLSGNVLAIYEKDQLDTDTNVILKEQPIYAAGRIGVLDKATDEIHYELKDNVNNTRVTFRSNADTAEILSWVDKYMGGMDMPGRSYNSGTYRYGGFQGQEKAVSSNWDRFELRMYNSSILRFLTPDPYGQFASPYAAMANNFINGTDPDGGYFNVGHGGSGDFSGGSGQYNRMVSMGYMLTEGMWVEDKHSLAYLKRRKAELRAALEYELNEVQNFHYVGGRYSNFTGGYTEMRDKIDAINAKYASLAQGSGVDLMGAGLIAQSGMAPSVSLGEMAHLAVRDVGEDFWQGLTQSMRSRAANDALNAQTKAEIKFKMNLKRLQYTNDGNLLASSYDGVGNISNPAQIFQYSPAMNDIGNTIQQGMENFHNNINNTMQQIHQNVIMPVYNMYYDMLHPTDLPNPDFVDPMLKDFFEHDMFSPLNQ